MNPSIRTMGRLFHLPALVGVELDLEPASTFMISPPCVYAFVLMALPPVLLYTQFEAAILQNRAGLIHGSNIVLTIGNKCVANAIVDLLHVLLDRLIRFVS